MNQLQKIEPEDLQLTAVLPQEMITAQAQLLTWCEKKVAAVEYDVKELAGAVEQAKRNGWGSDTLIRHHGLAVKKLQYYVKLHAAVQAGYYIVPNFPITYFAVRTDKKKPVKMLTTDHWHHQGSKEQLTHDVPLGEGEYKNPNPVIKCSAPLHEGTQDRHIWAEDWQDEIEFPISMAKPLIMEVTAQAMAEKIFDRFGIMPAIVKNNDPLIIGQIVRKMPGSYGTIKIVSFMIAWHLNTNVL